MTFARVNALGWGLYEILTSTQMNNLDIDHTNALDGLNGGTYDPANPLIIEGTDGIHLKTGKVPNLGTLSVLSGGLLEVQSGGTANVDSGGTMNVNGDLNVGNAATLDVNSGGTLSVKSGGDAVIESGGVATVNAGGLLDVAGGAQVSGSGTFKFGVSQELQYDPARVDVLFTQRMSEVLAVSSVSGGSQGLGGSDFLFINSAGYVNWHQQTIGPGTVYIHFGLGNIPPRCTITKVRLGLKGAAGHTWPIGTPAQMSLLKHSIADSITTTIDVSADASASAAAYQALHEIDTGAISEVVDGSAWYSLTVEGEKGTNALTGLRLHYIIVEATVVYATYADPV